MEKRNLVAALLLVGLIATIAARPPSVAPAQGRPGLRAQDLVLCGVRLGMSERDVCRIKGPPTVAKGPHVAYLTTVGFQCFDEQFSFESNQLVSASGWQLAIPRSNVELKYGMSAQEGLLLKQLCGTPKAYDDRGGYWAFQDFQLIVSVQNDRFTSFALQRTKVP